MPTAIGEMPSGRMAPAGYVLTQHAEPVGRGQRPAPSGSGACPEPCGGCRKIGTPTRDPRTGLEVVLNHDPIVDKALNDREMVGDADAIP